MNNRAYQLSTYRFKRDESVLFDTNVWAYIQPAPSAPTRWQTKVYSKALRRMLNARVRLILDALVLSEYLNSYCRIEWRALYQSKYPNFKRFRQSSDFRRVANAVTTNARSILKLTTRANHPFRIIDVNRVLNDFDAGGIDFNDGLLQEICRHNDWKLVTDDSDFTSGGIEILTQNRKLLNACRAQP